uniref:Cadherin domain-containing protein n=1 Tax=Capitella teleta TaxID=283909 RepID=X1ZY04_CAPTE
MAYKVNVLFTLFLTLLAAGPTTAFQMEVVPVVSGELVVLENQPIGSHLAYLKVTGRAGEVQCRVRDSEVVSIQQINSTFYDIVTSAVFDREVQNEYTARLVCEIYSEGRYDEIRLKLQVKEATDDPPAVGHTSVLHIEVVPKVNGELTVLENQPVGSHLAFLKVTGGFGGVHCRIRGSEVASIQQINSTFYDIVTSAVFDRETPRRSSSLLQCFSEGDGRMEGIRLNIQIREATVNLPTAGSTLQMEIVPDLPGGLTVLEHRPVGSHLAYLKVDGGVVQCRVRSSNVVSLQKLTSTFYNIVTRAVFDHETQDEYAVRLECESDESEFNYPYGQLGTVAVLWNKVMTTVLSLKAQMQSKVDEQ